MNWRFLIWALIMIMSLIVMGLAMRVLALADISLADGLIVRGVSCLGLVILFAYGKALSLVPKAPSTQCVRALLAGFALTLFTLSYNWLTASAVSVLSNIDVPLLVVLGPFIGIRASIKVRALSFVSILFLVWYVLGLEVQPQLFYGLTSLMTACFLLCFGYVFIKKSMEEENQAIAILTPALAIIMYGLMQKVVFYSAPSLWTPTLICTAMVSGVGMFFAYIATMKLYELTDIANAEFPTLISSLVIQPFEWMILDVSFQVIYVMPTIIFVLMTYFLLQAQRHQEEVINAH